jgi:hypothetical protein
MKASIKSYIADRKPLIPLKYDLSWEEFVAFREEAKESVPGWEKLSYVITSSKTTSSSWFQSSVDYQTNMNQLIIQCLGSGHEIVSDVFMHFWPSQTNSTAHKGVLKNILVMGSADMDLQDGTGKQPDFSFIDRSEGLVNEEEWCFPTIIIEVAYTESSQKLAVDCGRYIACSMGRGLLAIAIDIKVDKDGKLVSVRFAKWELDSIEEIETWPPVEGSMFYDRELDKLYRSDDGPPRAPATSFYCICRVGPAANAAYYAFHAKEVEACVVGCPVFFANIF